MPLLNGTQKDTTISLTLILAKPTTKERNHKHPVFFFFFFLIGKETQTSLSYQGTTRCANISLKGLFPDPERHNQSGQSGTMTVYACFWV